MGVQEAMKEGTVEYTGGSRRVQKGTGTIQRGTGDYRRVQMGTGWYRRLHNI
jgi:hypothetical protein